MGISLAKQLIAEGDASFVDEDYTTSVESYSRALSALDGETAAASQNHSDSDNNADRIEALAHRSAANLKLEKFEAALVDCVSALQLLHPTSAGCDAAQRSIILECRRSEALFHLSRFEQAQKQIEIIFQKVSSGTNKVIDNSVFFQKRLAKLRRILDQCPQKEVEDLDDKVMTQLKTSDVIASFGNGAESELLPHPNASSSGRDEVPRKDTPSSIVTKRLSKPVPNVPKYQYYQSDTFVTISVLEGGVTAEALQVEFEPNHLTMILHKEGTDVTVICGTLFDEINPDKCKINYKAEKVLLKLRKVQDGVTWHKLLGNGGSKKEVKKPTKQNPAKPVPKDAAVEVSSTVDNAIANAGSDSGTTAKASCVASIENKRAGTAATPYASNRDWNAIERELEAQEDEPEGDEAMNNLFKQIYSDANEDTRRAMIKSFQTSGGTVLSTNWDDVGKTDYEKERQAPKGMEWKNWEGAKLPQKED